MPIKNGIETKYFRPISIFSVDWQRLLRRSQSALQGASLPAKAKRYADLWREVNGSTLYVLVEKLAAHLQKFELAAKDDSEDGHEGEENDGG
jgi:hypothetical protein